MNKIVVVDYGMGNLRSVAQALRAVAPEADVRISGEPADIDGADRIVLPGQGAMPDCMRSLRESGVLEAVLRAADSRPVLGVCIGEQMLFDSSEEGDAAGLGLLPGKVVRFQLDGQVQEDGSRFKVPQMGWNQVRQTASHAMWDCIPTTRISTLCTAILLNLKKRRTRWARLSMARRSLAPSRVIIFSRHSFILKKVLPLACSCTRTLFTGNLDVTYVTFSAFFRFFTHFKPH